MTPQNTHFQDLNENLINIPKLEVLVQYILSPTMTKALRNTTHKYITIKFACFVVSPCSQMNSYLFLWESK